MIPEKKALRLHKQLVKLTKQDKSRAYMQYPVYDDESIYYVGSYVIGRIQRSALKDDASIIEDIDSLQVTGERKESNIRIFKHLSRRLLDLSEIRDGDNPLITPYLEPVFAAAKAIDSGVILHFYRDRQSRKHADRLGLISWTIPGVADGLAMPVNR